MRIGRLLVIVAVLCALLCPVSASADQYGVSFLTHATPSTLTATERYIVPLTLRNTGDIPWKRAQLFRLAFHWVDAAGNVVVRDGVRTELTRDVAPGDTIQLCATLVAPDAAGTYDLQWDMVHEQHTWFSGQDPKNVLTARVSVTSPASAAIDWRALLKVVLFWLITIAPLPLSAIWVRAWWGSRLTSWDEYLFQTVVFGLGQLYIVLQLLVFTVGMSITAVGVCLAIVNAGIAIAYSRRRSTDARAAAAGSDALAAKNLSPLDLLGSTLMLGLLIQWTSASARGIEILGTDAANYHVPHALDFASGINPMQFLATPHLYPMGTSVWAAWFFQPFGGPLLLEMATMPSFVLLLASTCLIFRLLTNRSGLAWTPWLMLIAFSGQLPRLSMLMSGDLAYAASFVAVAAALLLVWTTQSIDSRHTLSVALCAGWLASTKSTGVFSLAVMAGCAVVMLGLLYRRRRPLSGLGLPVVAAGCVLFVAAGAIWILRNWWLFGSPIAPYGASIFGIQLFPGPPASDTRYYLSVLGDMQDRPGYPLWMRFAESVREMFGTWIIPVAWLALLLPIDAVAQLVRRHGLSPQTKTKLIFAALVVGGFAVHAAVIAGLPWTSLDWTKNLSIRYLLPFYFLYLIALYSFLFTDFVSWDRSKTFWTIGALALAAGTLWFYGSHQATPGLPPDQWIATLSLHALVAAAAVAVPLYLALTGRARGVSSTAALVAGTAVVFALAWQGVADHNRIAASRAREARQESSCGTAGAAPSSEHRALYLGVVAFQQAQRITCPQTRFFMASRFDRPIEMQNADYTNLVLDARVSSPRALEQQGPRVRGCDVVIASKADLEAREASWLSGIFKAREPFERVAEYGRYVAFTPK